MFRKDKCVHAAALKTQSASARRAAGTADIAARAAVAATAAAAPCAPPPRGRASARRTLTVRSRDPWLPSSRSSFAPPSTSPPPSPYPDAISAPLACTPSSRLQDFKNSQNEISLKFREIWLLVSVAPVRTLCTAPCRTHATPPDQSNCSSSVVLA